MVSLRLKVLGSAVAIYLAGQQCQCPPIAFVPIAEAALQATAAAGSFGATLGGAIAGAHFTPPMDKLRRGERIQAPPGVPQHNFDLCTHDLADPSVTVMAHGPVENHGIRIEGLPPTCMTLATVIDGDAAGGARPTPCGSACLLYNNLNQDEYTTMRSAFYKLKNA